MKSIVLFLLAMMASGYVCAQTELSAFSATGGAYQTTFVNDYQCLGINPANLGYTRNDHKMNLGFFETTASVYSEPLTRKQVMNDLFDNSLKLSITEKEEAVKMFTDARLTGIGDFMYLGFSYQHPKIGGFAFNIRERMYWNSVLNEKGASFLFLGWRDPYFDQKVINQSGDTTEGISSNPQLCSKVYFGSEQNMLHTREFSLGYGRQIIEIDDEVTWYGGIGLRYILGFAGSQYFQEESTKVISFTALSPIYDVEYGDDELNPSYVPGPGMEKVGSGFGFDIGTTFRYKSLRVGLALNDIGKITWDGNVWEGNNVSVYSIETGGIDNYNIFEQGELIVTNRAPNDPEEWMPLESKEVKLPMNFRGGASYRFNRYVEAGFDVFIPVEKKVPGAHESVIFGIGAHYNPAEWVQLSAGITTGGNFATTVPLGVTFIPVNKQDNTWEVGFAVRDFLSYVKNNDPTVSMCFGFLRFSFGQQETASEGKE